MNFEDSRYLPKYKIIQEYIIDKIDIGNLKVGDRIPSEQWLANHFKVSRVTANTAIKELVTMGIVTRVQGLGSFVAKSCSNSGRKSSMLFGDNTKFNSKNDFLGKKDHSILSIKKIHPSKHYQKLFKVDEETYVYEIVRCVSGSNGVEECDFSYIPSPIYENKYSESNLLDDEHTDGLKNLYFHDYLKKYLSLNIRYIRIFIRSDLHEYTSFIKQYFKDATDLMFWDLVAYDDQNIPVGVTTTLSSKSSNNAFLTFEV